MSAADNLSAKLRRGVAHAQLRGHLIDAHRAEVLREAADLIEAWQNDADDASAAHHGALTDTETGAHMAVRRMARRLREAAGGAA